MKMGRAERNEHCESKCMHHLLHIMHDRKLSQLRFLYCNSCDSCPNPQNNSNLHYHYKPDIQYMLSQSHHPIIFNSSSENISSSPLQMQPCKEERPQQPMHKSNGTFNLSNNPQDFQLACKKDIKHFFSCQRRFMDLAFLEKRHSWFHIALRMFGWNKKERNEQEQEKPKRGKLDITTALNSETMSIVNRPLRSHNFLILVLGCRTTNTKTEEMYFDIELISLDSKIVYKKINLKNWQEIYVEAEKVKNAVGDVLLLTDDKKQLRALLSKNIEFQNLISRFSDISTLNVQEVEALMGRSQNSPPALSPEHIYEIIERRMYIKQSLLGLLQPASNLSLNINQLLAVTMSFNLVANLPLQFSKSLKSQLAPFEIFVIKQLWKEFQRQQNKCSSSLAANFHLPFSLLNAQNCWKCKMKRCYVCCPTCSKREGKNISLCLNCYEAHHQELKKNIGGCEPQQEVALKEWNSLNQQVQSLM